MSMEAMEGATPEVTESTQAAPETGAELTSAPGVTPTPEAPKAAPPVESPIAAIAKAKKRELAMKRELATRDQTLKQLQDEIASLKKGFEPFSKAKESPIQALMAAGYSYEDAVNYQLNQGQPTPDMAIKETRSEIEKLRQELAQEKQDKAEREKLEAQARVQQVITELKESIGDHIATNADTYELINLHEQQDLVYQTIENHWNQQIEAYQEDPENTPKPKVMQVKEASDLVEKYLEDQVEKALKSKKLSSRLAPQSTSKTEGSAQAPTSKTLTNSMASTTASKVPARTDQERMARALAALEKHS